MCLVAQAGVDDENPDVRRLEFRVRIANVLADGRESELADASPGSDVVICAPPLGPKPGSLPGQAWLLKRPPFLQQREHEFQVHEGKVLPGVSVFMVGDTVRLSTADGTRLGMMSVSRPTVGGQPLERMDVRMNDTSGGVPVKFSASRRFGLRSAYAVVSDHGFGQVTDDRGVAVFDGWPVEADMAVEVYYPFAEQAFAVESKSLQVLHERWVVVPAGREGATHAIRIVPKGRDGLHSP